MNDNILHKTEIMNSNKEETLQCNCYALIYLDINVFTLNDFITELNKLINSDNEI